MITEEFASQPARYSVIYIGEPDNWTEFQPVQPLMNAP